MNEETTGKGESETPSRPKMTLHKRIVSFEESTPAEEPLFINYVQVAHAGGCSYIDVGVIPLDEILSQSDEATFLVLSRLVMSRETMVGLRDQITRLLEGADRHVDLTQTTP
jgi:hypothetical protein